MSYTTECEDCGTTVIFAQQGEAVVRGDAAIRTMSDQYESYMMEAGPGADVPRGISKWDHYCEEHAKQRGLTTVGAETGR